MCLCYKLAHVASPEAGHAGRLAANRVWEGNAVSFANRFSHSYVSGDADTRSAEPYAAPHIGRADPYGHPTPFAPVGYHNDGQHGDADLLAGYAHRSGRQRSGAHDL